MTRNHLPSVVGLLALLTVLTGLQPAFAQPAIKHPVNDYASVITPDQEDLLAERILEVHQLHGVQIAILVVDTTGDEPIEDYSWRVATQWGGGSAVRSDGILITLAIQDRRSRMELGYDAEVWITDAEAARFLDDQKPEFRTGDYAAGLRNIVELIGADLGKTDVSPEPGGETGYPPDGQKPGSRKDDILIVAFVVTLMMVAFVGLVIWVRRSDGITLSSVDYTTPYGTSTDYYTQGDWHSSSFGSPSVDDWPPSNSSFDHHADDGSEDHAFDHLLIPSFGADDDDDDDDDDWGSSSFSSSSNSRPWSGGGGSFGGGGASSSW